MTVIPDTTWIALEADPPTGERLHCRVALPDLTEHVQCAVDRHGVRHLLVTLQPDDAGIIDSQSRGLRVDTRELVTRDGSSGRYIDLVCIDNRVNTFLDLLGASLASALASGTSTAADAVRRELATWRRFWGQPQLTLLTREEQIGLFAEVWFLAIWLAPRLGVSAAVQRWRGPTGARHDFEWPAKAVEVKATTSTRGRVHRINGLEQLIPPQDGELFLFSLRLRETGSSANSLPALISHVRTVIGDSTDTLAMFEAALARVGYSPVHEDKYAQLTLEVVDGLLFRVTNDFPRLVPEHIHAPARAAIERVEYEINLGGVQHLALDADADIVTAIG